MAQESRIFTVTCIVENEGEIVVSHFDYQGATRENDAISKWHHECEYNRNANKTFRAYIVNEFGGVEMIDARTAS